MLDFRAARASKRFSDAVQVLCPDRRDSGNHGLLGSEAVGQGGILYVDRSVTSRLGKCATLQHTSARMTEPRAREGAGPLTNTCGSDRRFEFSATFSKNLTP